MRQLRCSGLIIPVSALLFAILLSPTPAFSQDRGTISGVVTDATGAAVPAAKVVGRNTATNLTQEATTGTDGTYSLLYLPAGSYSIQVEKAGFRMAQAAGVRVSVNTTSRVDFEMQLGEVTQTVEVTAAAPLLQTDRTDLGKVISSRAILDLPLFLGGGLRNNLAFVNLVPGVQGDVGNPRIGGGLLAGASLLLDGAEANSERRNDAGFQAVSAEAVEEFKVQTGTYSAEYGRTSNGIINFTTKSGTNELHGSGFYFNRNEVFNARRFTYGPGTREIRRQHLGGGSVGGPVFIPKIFDGRNKAFFFFAYEKSKFRSGSPSNVITLPIADFRRGDFRRYTDSDGNPVPLYDPIDANGNFIQDAFARPRMQCRGVLNVICPERIHPVAQTIQAELPLPDNPGEVFNNTRAVGLPGNDQDVVSIKGDYVFSDKNRIGGLFSRNFFGSPPNIGPVPGTLGENFTAGGVNKYYRVNHDYIFTPNLLSHFTFGHNRRDIDENGPTRTSDAFREATQVKGATGSPTGKNTEYRTEFGNFSNGVETFSPSRTFNFNEQVAWIKGKHSVKFGFQYLLAKYRRIDCNWCSGLVTFSEDATGNPGVSGRTGSNYAAFLLGLASGGNFNYGADIEFRFPYYAWYVQDDWKVTNKLTLNLGLRYELSYPKEESQHQNSNFNPSIPNPGAGGLLGALEFAGDGPGRSGKDRFQDLRKNAFG
ncbi:MAG: carboxypeptidase regulatory-like domain-containing protein, partial [Bryobacteraceae bacterium]